MVLGGLGKPANIQSPIGNSLIGDWDQKQALLLKTSPIQCCNLWILKLVNEEETHDLVLNKVLKNAFF